MLGGKGKGTLRTIEDIRGMKNENQCAVEWGK